MSLIEQIKIKKMRNRVFYQLLVLFMFLGAFSEVRAQDKKDVVIMVNGEKKEGKVSGISESVVKFRYTGEEFDYEIPKKDISSIEFSSGRVESFNAVNNAHVPPTDGAHEGSHPDRRNKIAVLPFAIISNDPGMQVEDLRKFTQNQTANTVRSEYGTLTLQDPLTTNALLAKNNITNDNMDSFTPAEIAEALGVEFIIFGSVKVTNQGTTTYSSAGTSYKETTNKNQTKGNIFSSGSSSTTVNYDTMVDLRVFNDRGDNLYSNSRHSIGTGTDAYKGSVDYMIRRTPFGSKYGKK